MKKVLLIRNLLIFFFVSLIFSSCVTYEYQRGRPAVYDNANIKRVAIWSFNNNEFTDYLTERLIRSSRWSIVDRSNIARIIQEQNFQTSGRVDENTAIQIGKIMGVDAVLFGEYRPDSIVIKMVDIETAEYLVYQTIKISSQYSKDYHSRVAATLLVPHTIRYEYENNIFGKKTFNGSVVIVLGHTADTEIFE